ncbi:hypothetical protein EC912_103504 [Luteibacter rhizovicinus]|uniref:Uncharacterized protein n=1 Tax=Luteibacter rhizovicinus TaxID=242606 RepID=A0A4R3YRF7_9GAMM|nr:hypothetical protein [Luteibacter rhizovicinus]TCV95011.1 hypothetical protein EC912_103504 [Luteibacter rhizovicinus]
MFGWLATFGVHARARSTPVTQWLAVAPRPLIERLAQLGGVLYLALPRRESTDDVPLAGCLVEHAELAPLLCTRYVGLTCAVTSEGPREWIECADDAGRLLARIYLLPDTDYLAWDGLFVGGIPVDVPARWGKATDICGMARARVLRFTRHRVAELDVLGSRPVSISILGQGVARDIALSESVAMSG